MILTYESGQQAKVIAVSAGRVKVDFNHPLAGKKLRYTFRIIKKVDDLKEQFDGLIEMLIGYKLNQDLYEVDVGKRVIALDKSIESLKGFVEDLARKYLKNVEVEVKKIKKGKDNENSNQTK